MPPIQKLLNVTLTNAGNTITVKVKPSSQKIKNSPTDEYVLIWKANGASAQFPSSDFFKWKDGPAGKPAVKRDATDPGKLISDPFKNDGSGALWEYEVTIANGTFTVLIDPEVDNQPPVGPIPPVVKPKKG